MIGNEELKEPYCKWHDRPLHDISEVQWEACCDNHLDCEACGCLDFKRRVDYEES